MSSKSNYTPRITGFLCNWCCYGGADLCGVSRFQYPPYIRVIRVMCSGRVDPSFVLRVFSNGGDGVFIGGCHINDCHYNTEGNYDAYGMVQILKRLLDHIGINPERLRLEWVSAGEGIRFAEIMNEYGKRIREMGPLINDTGNSMEEIRKRIEAVTKIIPYIKLVEIERLRLHTRSESAYKEFYESEDFHRLFNELIEDKLCINEITALLKRKPLSSAEIAGALKMTPSEVSRHIRNSSNYGLVKFDFNNNSYTLA